MNLNSLSARSAAIIAGTAAIIMGVAFNIAFSKELVPVEYSGKVVLVVLFLVPLLLAVFLYIEARMLRQFNFSNPFVIFAVLTGLFFFLRPFVLIFEPELAFRDVFFSSWSERATYVAKALILVNVEIIALFVSYYLVFLRLSRGGVPPVDYPAPTRNDGRPLMILATFFLFLAFLGSLVATHGHYFEFITAIDRNAYMQTFSGRIGYLFMLFAVPTPVLVYAVYLVRKRPSALMNVVYVVFAILSLAILSLSRGRGLFAGPILGCIVLYSIMVRRVGIPALLVLAVFGGALVPARTYLNAELNPQLSATANAVLKNITATQALPLALVDFVEHTGSRFDNCVEVIRRTPYGIPYDYGEHMLGILFSPLPTAMRPIEGSSAFTRLFFPEVYYRGTGRAAPMLSEFYWSFSVASPVLVGIFGGSLMAVVGFFKLRFRPRKRKERSLEMACEAVIFSLLLPVISIVTYSTFTKGITGIVISIISMAPLFVLRYRHEVLHYVMTSARAPSLASGEVGQ